MNSIFYKLNKHLALLIFLLTCANFSFSQKSQMSQPFEFTTEKPIDYTRNGNIKMDNISNVPLQISGLRDFQIGNSPEEKSTNWLKKQLSTFKLTGSLEENLTPAFVHKGPSGTVVRYNQIHNGINVYKSNIAIKVTNEGYISFVSSSLKPNLEPINSEPQLSTAQAQLLVKTHINLNSEPHFEKAELTVYHSNENTRLAYRTITECENPMGSWEVMVDAVSGDILKASNLALNYCNHKHKKCNHPGTKCNSEPPNKIKSMASMATGTGFIYDPDPLAPTGSSYGGDYSDNSDNTNASLDAARSSVTLSDIELVSGTYKLKSQYAEIVDFESPIKGLFTQSSSVFEFDRNEDGFEAVNVFYHIHNIMRFINEDLGISVSPSAYSGGVQFDPHGLNGADNSHYLGGSQRVAFGEGGVDDAEDADVVIHELGHGLHDWLTGGNLSQVDGLSEGCGDYIAKSYARSLNQWSETDPQYNWVFGWDGHNPFWNGRITNYTGIYPTDLTGSIHANGQMWSSSLMLIYNEVGREQMDKAFYEGLAMTTNNTNQEDAAIAVRQAAIDMQYSCEDVEEFTTSFSARGYTMPPLEDAPMITSQPVDQFPCSGQITFSITADDATSYQWQGDTGTGFMDIQDDAVYMGSMTNSLELISPDASYDNSMYRCIAIGSACLRDTSTAATYNPTPAIITWNGSVSSDWFNPSNWTPNTLPNATNHVIISDSSPLPNPVSIANGKGDCYKIDVISATNADLLSIDDSAQLIVHGCQ